MAATFISMIAEAKLNFGAVALTLAIGAFYLISQNYPSSRYNLVIFFSLAFIAASVFMNAGKAERLCQSADAVLAIHALQVIMLLISAFVSIWLRQLRVYIAVMALSGFFIWKFFGWCPATFLEQKLRKIRGEKINFEEKGCIGHYIGKWLGLEVSAKKVEMSTYVLEALLFAWWGIDFLLF
ncbi:DUF2784 family protein [Candidatus Woesearchaeota archaeon]|nr:DUF2784 family protein [Candidatus Woesearchaeota archaeon]